MSRPASPLLFVGQLVRSEYKRAYLCDVVYCAGR
jgi:hypothetical protein